MKPSERIWQLMDQNPGGWPDTLTHAVIAYLDEQHERGERLANDPAGALYEKEKRRWASEDEKPGDG
jgi:hypothetical protein